MRFALALSFGFAVFAAASAQQHIAPTEAKTPAEEQKTFKVPAGFEVQLVAAEPDIGKPIQIAFDAKGRLWVTTSRHYPFLASDKASDKLFVLSDFDANGKAKKVVAFADDLNIPIGILPLPDCKSCLVSSAGEIRKYTDTDGDDKADKMEVILKGFGVKDTHGMYNSFILMPDGWVYACHGFNNDSTVKAADGSSVRLVSGNTFRFKPDGSRIEQWTWGQVNPFGMTLDPYFNLYTADCHSKPITQLIRGAYYDSFGKPHDGLGYAPHVTRHDHGSTALCGLAWYHADHFPNEWSGCLFLGNVVTNRINADRIVWKGGTPVAEELPDFLSSSDPWFRPTDIKLGPDGALYFADFYNRIIGHYEVPLNHPQRDKDRGRVWRIVWKQTTPRIPEDATKREVKDLVEELCGPNLTNRVFAANELARRVNAGTLQTLDGDQNVLNNPEKVSTSFGLLAYIGEQTGVPKITAETYPALLNHARATIETDPAKYTGMVIRAMGTKTEWGETERKVAIECATKLPAEAVYIRRSAIDGMIAHPHADFVPALVEVLKKLSKDDAITRHAVRVALRNSLQSEGGWAAAKDADRAIIAEMALAVPTKQAATFLLERIQAGTVDPLFCERIGRFGDDDQAVIVVDSAKAMNVTALAALVRGMQTRGGQLPADSRKVIEESCQLGLKSAEPNAIKSAMDMAAGLKLGSQFEGLQKFVQRTDRSDGQRADALAALMAIDADKATPILAAVLVEPKSPFTLIDRSAQQLAGSNRPAAKAAVLSALQTAPAKVQSAIANGLAGSPAGADTLLDAVKQGKASARLLQERAVSTKILAHENGKRRATLDSLTKGLPSADARIAELIATRVAGFVKSKADPEEGKKVFAKHCAACHQVAGQGGKYGPNLDGIGIRGPERLAEDILDPNRNVDAAFKATVLNMLDGRTITGLLREEGQVLVLADPNGKELRIDSKDVDKRITSVLSAMPANVDMIVPEADFHQLLAYLLSLKAK